MRDFTPKDDTVLVAALAVLQAMLPYSKYPAEMRKAIHEHTTQLIERIQSTYQQG